MRSSVVLLLFGFLSVCAALNTNSSVATGARHFQDSISQGVQSAEGTLRTAWGQFSDFFTHGLHKAEDLFATDKSALDAKVNETVHYLEKVKQDQAKLITKAKESEQNETVAALNKVDEFLTTARKFQNTLESKAQNFNNLEQSWEAQARQMYDSGLKHIVEQTQNLNGAATITVTLAYVMVMLIAQIIFV